jgi:uncharacterized membrane protein YgaE (UPF0421/DUF939 family)
MCKNPVSTATALMEGIETSLVAFLAAFNLTNTPAGIAVIAAFNAALVALQNWKSGTVAQNVLELLADLQKAMALLPIPVTAQVLVNIILGGIITVIGIVTGNSPAPVGEAVHEETQAMYAAEVASMTAEKVQRLVPGFQRSIFHSPESQYKKAWDKAVVDGRFDPSLLLDQ